LKQIQDSFSQSGTELDIRFAELVNAGLNAVLVRIAANPLLLDVDVKYANAVGRVAAALATKLNDGQLTKTEAEDILWLIAEIIASNPKFLVDEQKELAAKVLTAVLDKVVADRSLSLRGDALIELLDGVMKVVAAYGKSLLGTESMDELVKRVLAVIDAGIDKARQELANSLGQTMLPVVLVALLQRWARDEISSLDVADPEFITAFQEIISEVMQRAA
jgi:hypothetical protein